MFSKDLERCDRISKVRTLHESNKPTCIPGTSQMILLCEFYESRLSLMQALEVGAVWVNCSQPCFTQAPWGGTKRSGFGRELGEW